MNIDSNEALDGALTALLRPRSLAVIVASSSRSTLGNVALNNLVNYRYQGRVTAVHAEAREIAGFSAVPSIEELPDGVDVVLASVPAGRVADTIRRLDRRGVPAAIINTAGFSPAEEAELKALARSSRIVMHGPNCMGHINLTDSTPLYTGGITSRIRPGAVGLIAQSGSAAISVINSTDVGFSKVVTIGSEYRVTGADYLRWFASDEATAVVGVILESIPNPDQFVHAVDRIQEAGKAMVVLKVGRSRIGARATMAHTGALVGSNDAFEAFAARCGVPLVGDYEELIAAMEAFAQCRHRPARAGAALMGISGGETALACDLCDEIGLELTVFSDTTRAAIQAALPGLPGENPLDIGQSVGRSPEGSLVGMSAIMVAEETGFGVIVQDIQATLPETSHHNYTVHLTAVATLARTTEKPIVLISPTTARMSERLLGCLADTGIPALRGLRAGLAAVKAMTMWATRRPDTQRRVDRELGPEHAALRRELAGIRGPLSADLTARLLDLYKIPVVKSVVVASAAEAERAAEAIGYPLVAKVVSADIPHRSDIGAVQLGITDAVGLAEAIARIELNVSHHRPGAVIDGFELQEELIDRVQAMVGYQSAPPYGALMVVGTGGVLVELEDDRALSLSPASSAEALAAIGSTRLGQRLAGYRTLMPPTDMAPLAGLVSRLSELAAHFHDLVPECDLNPVLVRKGSGEVRVVDALFVASGD